MKRFCQDDFGGTAVEYSLVLGLIILVLVGSMTAISTSLRLALQQSSRAVGYEAPQGITQPAD